jgi:hypothetical protein
MDAAQLRPLRVGEILDLAIKIYRARFSHMVKAVAAILLPVAVMTSLLQISANSTSFSTSGGSIDSPTTVDGGDLAAFAVAIGLTAILTFIGGQLAAAATFKLVSGEYLSEEPDWHASLEVARQRLASLVWLAVLLGFFLILAFVACVVPAIYFYGAWSVAVPVLILEDLRGRKALKRSRQLVKGRWWPTMGVIVLSAILTGILQAIVSGVLVAVVAVAGNDVVDVITRGLAQATTSIFLGPFTATVLAVLYFDLRVRKEGFDLELLARRLGTEV